MVATPPVIPVPPVLSPSGSSVGWSFSRWLIKNKGDLKLLVSSATGLGTAWISQHIAGDLAAALGLVVALASKFALDWIDHRYTENPT